MVAANLWRPADHMSRLACAASERHKAAAPRQHLVGEWGQDYTGNHHRPPWQPQAMQLLVDVAVARQSDVTIGLGITEPSGGTSGSSPAEPPALM